MRLLEHLVEAESCSDDDSDDETDVVVLQSVVGYAQAFFEKVLPPAEFGAHFRRNCELADVLENCASDYRFRTRSDLRRVINSLDLPEQCGPFDNGSFLPRDACFLFFLRRLASRATLRELMERFGGERTLWGRAVKWMAIYIHERWGHKLESDFAYWAPQFPTFAACIRAVANAHPAEPAFPPEFGVAAIIDNNITETCTPGSGPATPGPGAHRRDPAGLLQRTFYTGWLHLHGVKHQVVMAPNGMILMIWGPCSCRHNDLYSLDKSGVLDKWMKAMPTGHQIYLLYGDSIYPWRPGLRSRHGAPVGDLHKQDVAMSSCRQLIENGFGLADTEFPYLSTPSSMKIMSGMPIKELYFCKMYLTNLLLCLYEGQTSLRFACSPPALEDYVAGV